MLAQRALGTRSTEILPSPRGGGRGIPRPFMKWAGGKAQLLKHYQSLLPSSWSRYFEPFVGGGAMFFHHGDAGAILNDANPELHNAYSVVQGQVEDLIVALREHTYDRDHYYAVRAQDPAGLAPVEAAARTIFLNRTGFNGLYRVNKSGQFNVPFGRYTNPTICDEENLRACQEQLAGVELRCGDFADAVHDAGHGDFVYLDPPYAPVSQTSMFTSYIAGGFDFDEQRRLGDLLLRLHRRGAAFMVSNSDAPGLCAMYEGAGWFVDRVLASRSINSKGSARGKVCELVVRNYR